MGEGRAPSAESHPFPADKPGPPRLSCLPRASPVPAPRRPAAASCSTHLESVPDGRAATRAPGTDSSSQNGGGGGEGGGARTRERAARPRQASGTERGAGGGGATARTHSHTRAPTPPPAAPRPRGRAAAVGNGATCWRLSATARAPAALALFSPSARGPASPAPTAPASQRLWASLLPGRARLRLSPPRERRKSAAAGADLAWEGNRVSLVSLLPGSFPPPPSSTAWNRSGARPVGPPPEPPMVTASRQSRTGGPRPPTAELREVCHTSRGATGWHGNGAAEPRPLSGQDGRHALWGGLRRGGQEERVSEYIL